MRQHLSYANVMATVAVFIALGGTSYALTLPRNSVGASQIRPNAVGPSELRSGAVTSRDVRDRGLGVRDLARSARRSLRGRSGPVGPSGPAGAPAVGYFAAINGAGGKVRGNPTSNDFVGPGALVVGFAQPVSACVATATLTPPAPPLGHITTEPSSDGRVLVRTWDASGNPTRLPFNLIVAC